MKRVVIIGAGPAGLRAAEVLVSAGLRPAIVNEAERGGGQIYRRQPDGFGRGLAELYGSEAVKADALHRLDEALTGSVDYHASALAWNIWERQVHVVSRGRNAVLDFDALIIATGATDRLIPLSGWTLPNVYSLGGAQIALKAQACSIGSRVAFVGTGPLLYLVAYQYLKAGADIAVVLDTSKASNRIPAFLNMAARPKVMAQGLRYIAALRRGGVQVVTGAVPLAIEGDSNGPKALLAQVEGKEFRVTCDAVAMGYHLRPETQLADLARCAFTFDPITALWTPSIDGDGRTSVAGIYVAGDGSLPLGADAAELSGKLAAYAALADLGHDVPLARVSGLRREHEKMKRFAAGLTRAFPWPAKLAANVPDETVLCRCEGITAGEFRAIAKDTGAPEVNRAKAMSRVGMGRCQGRYCGPAAAAVLAEVMNCPVEAIGRLRGQAPVKPLSIGSALER